MPKDTNVEQLILNKLTEAQYNQADTEGKINPNELYFVPDELEKASKVRYDNTRSKLKSNDVQGAIDDLAQQDKDLDKKIDNVQNGTVANANRINGYIVESMAQQTWESFTPQTDGIYFVYDPRAEV